MDTQAITRVCRDCSAPFVITAGELEFFTASALAPPLRCRGCRAERKQQRMTVVDDGCDERLECIDCASPFDFSAGEKAYFVQRGFARPRRCPACREQRRERGGRLRGVSEK